MKQTPKQFFSTPAGKLTLAFIAMVLCWTVFIVYISKTSAGGTLFPTESDMDRVQKEIKRDTSSREAARKEKQELDDLKAKYEASLATYWNADRDGEPETELRNLVNDAAQNAQANLQTLGAVRTSTINSELSYADLDFTVVDEYDKVIRFFAEIEKCTPRLSWRRVELRVEPTRARAVTGPGARQNNTTAAATTTPAQTFRATGQVRVIKYSPAGNTAKTATGKTSTTARTAASAAKTTTPTTTAATTAQAATSAPAAQQPASADGKAPASTPAKTEPAADEATTNKENGK